MTWHGKYLVHVIVLIKKLCFIFPNLPINEVETKGGGGELKRDQIAYQCVAEIKEFIKNSASKTHGCLLLL